MKKILIVLLFSVLFLDAKLTTPKNTMGINYTVQSGDTLFSIARQHHTSIKEMLDANHMERNAIIKVGQSLRVPLNTYIPEHATSKPARETPPAPAPKSQVDYTVQNGDTLYTIARTHHTSIRELLLANAMNMKTVIKVGQHLTVPVNTYSPPKTPSATQPTAARTQSKPRTAPRPTQAPSPAAAPASSGNYVVQNGDTLFSIARKNHVVISKLMRLNSMGLGDALRVGQVLKISTQSTFVASSSSAKKTTTKQHKKSTPIGAMPSYTVKKGDTLWKIARKHHLTLAEIRKLNKMRKKDHIRTGMVLAVGRAVKATPKVYKVKKGDTLWLIAKKHHMSTKTLRLLNGMHRKARIHTGMMLALAKDAKLPAKGRNDAVMVAKLKKRGVKKQDIATVMARIKKSKKKNPNISAILAQIKKEKKRKVIKTPLRITKKKKSARFGSALAMLNGNRNSSRSHWGGGNSKTIRIAKRYLGRRYVWGAVGPRSFDCSGFTQYVMRKSKGVRLPRVSRKQAYYGKYVSRRNLRAGDLIFFDTSRRRRGYVNHVGIYIGNHKFIHASSAKHRVVITSLNRPFYRSRFKWGRRVN